MRAHRGQPSFEGNGHHIAHCEPTLALMESIAETIPDAVFHAQKVAYESAIQDARSRDMITHSQMLLLQAHSPYAPVPPGWNTAAGSDGW